TKVAIIDDDSDYLAQISLLIDENLACDLFTSASQALSSIQSHDIKNRDFTQKYARQLKAGLNINGGPDTTIDQLHHFVYDEQRFNQFSVMVIDYAMPEMNGIDLCKQVQNPYIKKILITGKADTAVAIEAFNQGLIDQFIRKEEKNIEAHLNMAINKLSHQYFSECYSAKDDALSQERPYLFDQTFIEWFDQLCKTHKIVEYYLWGRRAIKGFLLVDNKGDYKILLIKRAQHEKPSHESTLNKTHASKIILLDSGDGALSINDRDHNNQHHVYPAKKIGNYYYALVKPDELPQSEIEDISYSYKQFLTKFHARPALNIANHAIEPDLSKNRYLANIQLFSELEIEELSVIMRGATHAITPKNTNIIFQGDTSNSMFLIISGKVRVYLKNDQNQEVTLNYLETGDFFGELAMIDEQPRSASVMSLTECELLILSSETLQYILNKYPKINQKVIRTLAKRMRNLTSKVETLALMGVYERVAKTLTDLATNKDGMMVIKPKPTHKDISNMIGASREMVTRVMSEMALKGHLTKDENCIIIEHEFTVPRKA
ncbi:cAMP-binding proteins - catabolite gene activator and regulatory subunit of cAMP-dependent protein kinases, partial [hydrothermal vent metagenome]